MKSKERTYTVLYEKGPTSWGAYVPEFEGCIAVGKTREEVEKRIRGALEAHIKLMAKGGEQIPEPTIFPGQVTVAVADEVREPSDQSNDPKITAATTGQYGLAG